MTAAGYDPSGSTAILESLARSAALQARIQGEDNRQLPEWASTHPLSEHRAQQALAFVRQTGRMGTGTRNRDQFLQQLDGITVDDDPSQGIIDGRTFTHPDLKIQFTVPPGYLMQNGARAVSIKGSGGEAEFSGGGYRGSLDTYIYKVLQNLTGGKQRLNIPPPRHVSVNGMPAAYTTTRAQTNSGVMDVSVVAYQWDADTVYHFVILTPGGTGIGPLTPLVNSLRRISPAEAAAIRPRVIDVVTVSRSDTVQSLASRMAYRNFQLERFLSLNDLSASQPLVPGQRVKLIVYGARRS
jgi:predicted Zn-dependent protease